MSEQGPSRPGDNVSEPSTGVDGSAMSRGGVGDEAARSEGSALVSGEVGPSEPWAEPPRAQVAWGYVPTGPELGPCAAPLGAAIHAPSHVDGPPQRSAAASVIGIVGIIAGVLCTLGDASCAALSTLMASHGRSPDGVDALLRLDVGIRGVWVLMSIALTIIGVGLWRHRDTARKAMLVWSTLALLLTAGLIATEKFVIQPRSAPLQEAALAQSGMKIRPEDAPAMRRARGVISQVAIWNHLIWAVYPAVALILLPRSGVRDRCS
jgi:hypothetical protein